MRIAQIVPARFVLLIGALGALAWGALPAAGESAPGCTFTAGFKALRDLIPTVVGECVDDQTYDPVSGDASQRTTAYHGKGGLLVWRKSDNWTAFTDGSRTWINGPEGLQSRLNGDCFDWETCPIVPPQTLGAPRAGAASVPVSADEVVRGDPSRPWISLIFNAGAGYPPAPAILDTLKAKGVRTTFFLMGWWAEQNPDLVRRIAAEGHEVASHGYKVFDLTEVSNAEVVGDLERADAAIAGILGRTTRPLWSASASARDARVNRLAASIGYRPIFWTVDGGDWRTDSTAEGVRNRVLGGAVNGAIIVMHFESPRTADTIAPALPGIIDGLRARGFRLVTVTDLVTASASGYPLSGADATP